MFRCRPGRLDCRRIVQALAARDPDGHVGVDAVDDGTLADVSFAGGLVGGCAACRGPSLSPGRRVYASCQCID